jgi:hypothetical protein
LWYDFVPSTQYIGCAVLPAGVSMRSRDGAPADEVPRLRPDTASIADSLCRTTFGGFNPLQTVNEQPCRPFRSNRSGMSLGEGGAVLILEQP